MPWTLRSFMLLAALLLPAVAYGQAPQQANVVSACGTPNSTYPVNGTRPLTVDTTGNACTSTVVPPVTAVSAADAAANPPSLSPGPAQAINQSLHGEQWTSGAGSVNGGTASGGSLLSGGVYRSGAITLTNGQQAALALDSDGGLSAYAPNMAATGSITTQNLNLNSGAATAGSTVVINTDARSTVTWQVTGVFTGTLIQQASNDGSNWVTITNSFWDVNTNNITGSVFGTGPSSLNSIVRANVSGYSLYRLTASTAITGTAAVTGEATQGGGLMNIVNGTVQGFGTAGTPTGGILTVQGVTSMTPILISPSTTAVGAAATNATTPLAVQMMVSDGTNLQRVLDAVVLADGVNGNNEVPVTNWYFNGSTWDRQKGTAAGGAWVQGPAANGATAAGNPLLTGCRAASQTPTAVTDGQVQMIECGLNGKVTVIPYSIKELAVGGGDVTITGSGAQTIIAASGSASLLTYITSVQCSNYGTVAVKVTANDAWTHSWIVPAGGGTNPTFPVPLRTAANTAFTLAGSAAGTGGAIVCDAAGYKGN